MLIQFFRTCHRKFTHTSNRQPADKLTQGLARPDLYHQAQDQDWKCLNLNDEMTQKDDSINDETGQKLSTPRLR